MLVLHKDVPLRFEANLVESIQMLYFGVWASLWPVLFKITVVNDSSRVVTCQCVMPQLGASLTVINYARRAINCAPRVVNYGHR